MRAPRLRRPYWSGRALKLVHSPLREAHYRQFMT